MGSLDEILENFNRLLKIQYQLAKSPNDNIKAVSSTGVSTTVNRSSFDHMVGNVYQQVRKISDPRTICSSIKTIVKISPLREGDRTSFITSTDNYSSLVNSIFKDAFEHYRFHFETEDLEGETEESLQADWPTFSQASLDAFRKLERDWLKYFKDRQLGLNPTIPDSSTFSGRGEYYHEPGRYLILEDPWGAANYNYYIVDTVLNQEFDI